MRKFIVTILFLVSSQVNAQELTETLSLQEYLGYVKKFHPLVKQANLVITEGEAKLLKSRGAFDPKLEVDYDRKQFKGSEYFDKLNYKMGLDYNDHLFKNMIAYHFLVISSYIWLFAGIVVTSSYTTVGVLFYFSIYFMTNVFNHLAFYAKYEYYPTEEIDKIVTKNR